MKHSLSASGIQSVLRSTKPKHSNNLKVFLKPSSCFSIGFALGGWSGSAVERNRFKRQSREIVKNYYLSKEPVHVLIQAKKKLKNIEALKKEILSVLESSKKGL